VAYVARNSVERFCQPRLGCVVVSDTPALPRMRTVEEVYGSAFAEEEAFEAALDQSLAPRGFDLLFDLVADLSLPPGSTALDVGARDGYYCIELARRFGFTVHGIEPVRRHLDQAAAPWNPSPLQNLRSPPHQDRRRYRERLPEQDASTDLIWCRDVLEHVRTWRPSSASSAGSCGPAATR